MEQPTENPSPTGNRGSTSEATRGSTRPVRATSAVLLSIADNAAGPKVSLGEVVDQLGERSFGMLLLVLGLCGWVPGLAARRGDHIRDWYRPDRYPDGHWPLAALASQNPDKPPRVSRAIRGGDTSDCADPAPLRVLCAAAPPGADPLSTAERMLGVYVVILGGVVCIPLPMTNAFPALSVAVIAIGLIERDGVAVLIGALSGVLSVVTLFAFWSGAYIGLTSIFGASS